MSYVLKTILAVLALAFVSASAPAFADGPVSLYVGGAGLYQTEDSGGFLGDIAAGYDLGPKATVPLRARIDADVSFPAFTNFSYFSTYGIGASIRSTTPTYVGLGVGYYVVNVPCCTGPTDESIVPFGDNQPAPSLTTSGVGATIFFGQRLFSSHALGLALEVSYKELPGIGDKNPSAVGLGLRGSF